MHARGESQRPRQVLGGVSSGVPARPEPDAQVCAGRGRVCVLEKTPELSSDCPKGPTPRRGWEPLRECCSVTFRELLRTSLLGPPSISEAGAAGPCSPSRSPERELGFGVTWRHTESWTWRWGGALVRRRSDTLPCGRGGADSGRRGGAGGSAGGPGKGGEKRSRPGASVAASLERCQGTSRMMEIL